MRKVYRALCRSSWIAALAFFAGAMLSSCTSPGAFRNVPRSQPHAVLIAEETDFPLTPFTPATESLIRSINGKPVEHADRRNRFRIPPGITVIEPEIEGNPKQYSPLQFNAVTGHEYFLFPLGKGMRIHLIEKIPGKRAKIIAIWTGGEWREGLLGRPLNTTPRSNQSPSTTR